MTEMVIAVDFGGTNMRGGIVDVQGNISSRISKRTPQYQSADKIISAVADLIIQLSNSNDSIRVVGIAAAAVLDLRDLSKTEWPNVLQLEGIDFPLEIRKRTDLQVIIENDATAAAIGEHWHGAAKGTDNVICITLGTGVGGGIIVNGKPVTGVTGTAGEIGHICLDIDGPKCGCGSNGCLEQYSSGTAIVRKVNELFAEFPDSSLRLLPDYSPEEVYDAGKNGDAAALRAFEEAGTRLGMALAGIVNLLNPEVIVITGGVAGAWELFIDATMNEVRKRAFHQPAERVKIVRGALGDDAGILGVAKRAFERKGFS